MINVFGELVCGGKCVFVVFVCCFMLDGVWYCFVGIGFDSFVVLLVSVCCDLVRVIGWNEKVIVFKVSEVDDVFV